MKAEYVDTDREIERKSYAQQIGAVNEYKKREEVTLASADVLVFNTNIVLGYCCNLFEDV